MNTLTQQFEHLAKLEQQLSLDEAHLNPPESWAALLDALALGSPQQFQASLPLPESRADYALLMAIRLAVQIEQHAQLDEDLLGQLGPLWLVFACHGLRDWAVWQIARHPLRLTLDQIIGMSRSFQITEHAATQQYLQHLHTRLRNLARISLRHNTLEASLPALKSILDLLQQVRDQQREADKRVLELQAQTARSSHAHSAVSRAIRHNVLGQPVSALIVNFIDQHWRKYLYTVYLRHGMESVEWQQGLDDIRVMIEVGSFLPPDELKAKRKTLISPLIKRIEQAMTQIHLSEGVAIMFIQEFSDLVRARERNMPDAGLPLGDLPDHESDHDTPTHASGMDDHSIISGQIVWVRHKGVQKRARVIDVDLSHDQILLADFTGHLIAQFTQREWQRLREQADVAVIPEMSIFDFIQLDLPPFVNAVIELSENEIKRHRTAHRAKREAEIAANIEQRKKQEANERAKRIADAKESQHREVQQQLALQKIEALRSGALVQLLDSRAQLRPCYLAMINTEKDQYVFVDRQGKKFATHTRQELAQLFCEQNLRIMESGSALDSALQGLITERRQYLQEDDS